MRERIDDASGTLGGADAGLREPMGIPQLDRLLQGGLPEGNSLLVQGAPGTGKTILGMQFLYAGITQQDLPGLLVTFEEHPRRLYRDARALGWDFEALETGAQAAHRFHLARSVPMLEIASDQYSQMIRDYGFGRVVVDSLTKFESYPDMAEAARVRFERIVNALRLDDMSVMMTRETESREAPFRVTPEEYLADTLIQLEYRRLGDARDGRRIRLLEV